jgi:hypothetical protein
MGARGVVLSNMAALARPLRADQVYSSRRARCGRDGWRVQQKHGGAESFTYSRWYRWNKASLWLAVCSWGQLSAVGVRRRERGGERCEGSLRRETGGWGPQISSVLHFASLEYRSRPVSREGLLAVELSARLPPVRITRSWSWSWTLYLFYIPISRRSCTGAGPLLSPLDGNNEPHRPNIVAQLISRHWQLSIDDPGELQLRPTWRRSCACTLTTSLQSVVRYKKKPVPHGFLPRPLP